jgi:hypothetical protein
VIGFFPAVGFSEVVFSTAFSTVVVATVAIGFGSQFPVINSQKLGAGALLRTENRKLRTG